MEFLAHHTFAHTLNLGVGLVLSLIVGLTLLVRIILKETNK